LPSRVIYKDPDEEIDKYCRTPGVSVSAEIKTESPATLTRLDELAEFNAIPTAAD
jgi:hypothetical protein